MPSTRASRLAPEVVALLRWFECPYSADSHLHTIVKPFRELAWDTALTLPTSADLIEALTDLRRAKEATVRAHTLVSNPIAPEDLTEPDFDYSEPE